MKVLALFFLFLTAYATARPNSEETDAETPANTGTWFGGLLDNVKGYFYGAADTLTNALGYNGTFSDALSSISQTIQDKIAVGGKLTANLLARAVAKTLDTAVSNNITSLEVAQKIKATLNLPGAGEAESLEIADIENLQIDGNEGKAAQFREALVYLIEGKKSGNMSALQLLAVLECELIDLLAGNAIISMKGASDFKSYFNLDAIVNTIKNPKPALDTMADYYTNSIYPQIVELSQAALEFLANLKTKIVQSQLGQQIAQEAPELLDASVKYMTDLKNQIAQSQIVQQIVAEAPEIYNSSLNFLTDMKNQISQKAPEVYAEYVKYLADLKTQIAKSELAQEVAKKAPELYEEYVKYLSDLADKIAHSQIVQQVTNSTLTFVNDLKTKLAEKSSEQSLEE